MPAVAPIPAAILTGPDAHLQQRAYTVLGQLLALPLAAADWTIRRNGSLSMCLDGRLPDRFGENWSAEVLRYATELDLAIRRSPLPNPAWTKFEAHGMWRGVQVSVWTPMTRDDLKEWSR